MRFIYENNEDFGPLPSYFIQPGLMLSMGSGLIKSAFKEKDFDLTNVRLRFCQKQLSPLFITFHPF